MPLFLEKSLFVRYNKPVRQAIINKFMNKHIRNVHVAVVAIFLGIMPVSQATAQTFTNLHSFVYTNGINPHAGVIITNGVLYGTTESGGTEDLDPDDEYGNDGSVFRMNDDGSEFTNLYSFSGGPDGGALYSGVVLYEGTLYGEAIFGGASNNGCIFSIETNGTELYNIHNFAQTQSDPQYPFGTNGDGAYPSGGLVMVGNTLFGTASDGGLEGWGTTFALNTNGLFFLYTNLLNFNLSNGQNPDDGVTVSSNVIYGVTGSGGTNGYGTIYSMNTDGSDYSNLYSFSPDSIGNLRTNSDGAFPHCSLVVLGNTLYGTATGGGIFGNGTIYELNTDGSAFTVLHQFSTTNGVASTNADGAIPETSLLYWNNALYGTAYQGGKYGNGTVFKINLDGTGFKTLYSFSATNNVAGTNSDGANPLGALIASSNTLYGTTSAGGTGGYGTVFSLTFPFYLNIVLSDNSVVLFWPATDTGYDLQYATSLTPPVTWTTIPYSGTQNIVTNSVSNTQLYYRLMQP
jgi:uncharacterized repeat protein (TIGR03803 family)